MDTYKATNTTNGKFYIGSTTNFEKRKKAHLSSNEDYPFQRALRKNPSNFEWEVWSDDCDEPVLEQALLDIWYGKEQCYNLNPYASRPPKQDHRGSKNPNYGKTPSKSTRKKLSEAKTGNKHPMFGRSGDQSPTFGRVLTEKQRERLREVNTGKKDSAETRKRKSEAHLGKKWWVNAQGEVRSNKISPGPEWQRGRKWKG
jgi:group I intron endonuclease